MLWLNGIFLPKTRGQEPTLRGEVRTVPTFSKLKGHHHLCPRTSSYLQTLVQGSDGRTEVPLLELVPLQSPDSQGPQGGLGASQLSEHSPAGTQRCAGHSGSWQFSMESR